LTLRRDHVRSRSERIIADYLYHNKINYDYEKSPQNRGVRSRPDFYLTDYGVWVEYWGLVKAKDQETRSRYERRMQHKMYNYGKNGMKVISLFPDDLNDLDTAFKSKLKQATRTHVGS